jgi:hypothetical protein
MVSLYIRTFRGDICWLEYCLQSIHRNLRGWDEIIVCIPEGQEHHLAHLTTERMVICPAWKDDYIGQQVSKLQAHRHAKGDLILFVDSDLVFLPGADVKDLLVGGRPVIGKERYASPKDPAVRKWRPVVTKLFGQEPEWEYMGLNASSRLFHRSTLEAFERRFPDIEAYARRQPRHKFSEYNFLGFFAEQTEPDRYAFVDVHAETPPAMKARQFWSWGGITPEIRAELATLGLHGAWPDTLTFGERLRKDLDYGLRRFKLWLRSRRARKQ